MTPLYAYSLIPVLCVALLLFFTAALRGRRARGLAAYCLATAGWSATLLLTYFPSTAWLGQALAASGGFVVASYLHAAYDFTDQTSYGLVWFAYAVAVALTLAGALFPGLLYDPVDLSAGPFFWESMALAMIAASVPLATLAAAWRREDDSRARRQLLGLMGAGVLGYAGAWTNALLLSHGHVLPYGLFAVLGSLLVLTGVVQARQRTRDRRLMERSLLYAAMTAFLSAGFLFGVLTLMSESAEPLVTEYRYGAFFLLAMAALAFEPIRQHIQGFVGRFISRDQADVAQLADKLAEQEQRADQAERLAELGTFTSAIAHEVRNPLGVLSACVRVLEMEVRSKDGAAEETVDQETVDEMRQQIGRASEFLDELLAYGRPRKLELRMVELCDIIELAFSAASQALEDVASEIPGGIDLDLALDGATMIEADQAQLNQVFVILFENAILAAEPDAVEPSAARIRVAGRLDANTLHLVVEDNGPGLPQELEPQLFEPFVTGRKRDGKRTGTGLGLAICRRIVERHGGTIAAGRSETLGGAKFELALPRHQHVLAAATATATDSRAPVGKQDEP
jgi:signal transduction histidine kinase